MTPDVHGERTRVTLIGDDMIAQRVLDRLIATGLEIVTCLPGGEGSIDPRDPRGRSVDERDHEFSRLLLGSLATHRPEPDSMAVRLVTRRRRRRLDAAWWRLVRGGIDHEPVDLDEHQDFFRFCSESLLADVIQRHLEASVAGSSS